MSEMDPDQTLHMIRYYLAMLGEPEEDASWYVDHAYAIDGLIEHVTALNRWLDDGGALPTVWDQNR